MKPLQFWFDFASTYSYVAAMRIEREAAGLEVQWRPFLLGPIFQDQLGIKDSPFNVQPLRGKHMWRDLERLCQKHGIPWNRPTAFPRRSILAARVALAVEGLPLQPELCRRIFQANFAGDREIDDPALLESISTALGADGRDLVARAGSAEVKQLLRDRTADAQRLGFFGAPNFLIEGEHFFGQDRLEDAIAWARR